MENTESITNWNIYQPYFEIDMFYYSTLSNKEKSKRKEEIAVILAARFGFVSALVLTVVFKIQRHKTTEFLKKLCDKKLLIKVKTSRAVDGVIYVPTHTGIQYAIDIIRHDIPFRSKSNPIEQVNQNSIMHDSILQFVLMSGIQNHTSSGVHAPTWNGFLTEKEFMRVFPSNSIKNVDGIVLNSDGTVAAIEIENSFKNKAKTESTLLKLKASLLGTPPLFDKVFFVSSSDKIIKDTQRFQNQLLDELPNRYNKHTKSPMMTTEEAEELRQGLIFRTKFTESIQSTFYK